MSWVRLENNFMSNPKVLALQPLSILIYIASLCHASSHLTDGFLAVSIVRNGLYSCHARSRNRAVMELLEAGLWDKVEGGFQIRNYLKYQFSRQQVERSRQSGRSRQRKIRNGVTEQGRNAVTSRRDVTAGTCTLHNSTEVRLTSVPRTNKTSTVRTGKVGLALLSEMTPEVLGEFQKDKRFQTLDVAEQWEAASDYLRSTGGRLASGQLVRDIKAYFRNWLKRYIERSGMGQHYEETRWRNPRKGKIGEPGKSNLADAWRKEIGNARNNQGGS